MLLFGQDLVLLNNQEVRIIDAVLAQRSKNSFELAKSSK